MKTNPFYTWLPGLMTVVVTILGFLVFAPEEPTALFYVNLVYVVLLEVLFFGWFHMGKLKSDQAQTPYFKVFVGMHTLGYLVVSLVWMLIYSLLLSEKVDFKVYLLVIVILSLLWIVLASIIGGQDTQFICLKILSLFLKDSFAGYTILGAIIFTIGQLFDLLKHIH